MKNLKTLLLIAVFTLGINGAVNAQKVAHINAEQLIAAMPQTKALQAEMEKLQKTYKDEITGMAKKLEAKIQKYTAEQATQTQTVNEQRAQEVQQERARIQQAEQAAYQDMQKRQGEKLNPILELAQKAIKDVAADKGIIYVLDASAGKGLLVFEKGENIFDAVKAKLGF
jgi:outer membrane protein